MSCLQNNEAAPQLLHKELFTWNSTHYAEPPLPQSGEPVVVAVVMNRNCCCDCHLLSQAPDAAATDCWSPVYLKFINVERIECANWTRFYTAPPRALNNKYGKCESDESEGVLKNARPQQTICCHDQTSQTSGIIVTLTFLALMNQRINNIWILSIAWNDFWKWCVTQLFCFHLNMVIKHLHENGIMKIVLLHFHVYFH